MCRYPPFTTSCIGRPLVVISCLAQLCHHCLRGLTGLPAIEHALVEGHEGDCFVYDVLYAYPCIVGLCGEATTMGLVRGMGAFPSGRPLGRRHAPRIGAWTSSWITISTVLLVRPCDRWWQAIGATLARVCVWLSVCCGSRTHQLRWVLRAFATLVSAQGTARVCRSASCTCGASTSCDACRAPLGIAVFVGWEGVSSSQAASCAWPRLCRQRRRARGRGRVIRACG